MATQPGFVPLIVHPSKQGRPRERPARARRGGEQVPLRSEQTALPPPLIPALGRFDHFMQLLDLSLVFR
jgi:hypothetical protein